jgi:methionyl-tRNA synthetase
VRYFLLREAPFGSDFSIGEEKIRQRYNSDLGNDLGNLVRRSLAMLTRYREGIVPAVADSPLATRFAGLGERTGAHLEQLRFRDALEAAWELVTALNRGIDERKPWELHKAGDAAALDAVLYELCEGLRWIALLLAPFMPGKAGAIWTELGLDGAPDADWREALVWGKLPGGTRTQPAPEPLFPRIDALEPV